MSIDMFADFVRQAGHLARLEMENLMKRIIIVTRTPAYSGGPEPICGDCFRI
jgi:hypothetical protein